MIYYSTLGGVHGSVQVQEVPNIKAASHSGYHTHKTRNAAKAWVQAKKERML